MVLSASISSQSIRLEFTECADRNLFQIRWGPTRRRALAGVLAIKPDVKIVDEATMFVASRG